MGRKEVLTNGKLVPDVITHFDSGGVNYHNAFSSHQAPFQTGPWASGEQFKFLQDSHTIAAH